MKTKRLIVMAIIAPLLALSLAAKADTCPTPEQFEKKTETITYFKDGEYKTKTITFFSDKDNDFKLVEKPNSFAGAVFMALKSPTDKSDKLRHGKLYACRYLIEGDANKYALLQGAATKSATIADDSDDWKVITKVSNRYDCGSDDVNTCQFTLKK